MSGYVRNQIQIALKVFVNSVYLNIFFLFDFRSIHSYIILNFRRTVKPWIVFNAAQLRARKKSPVYKNTKKRKSRE